MKIRIEATAPGAGSRLWIDDTEITNLVSFGLSATRENGTVVTVELHPDAVTVEGEAMNVVRPQPTRERGAVPVRIDRRQGAVNSADSTPNA
jgi:hypothetical protein